MVPPQITPELPAKNVLDLFAGSDEVDAWHRATRWFGERTVAQIVAELVPCAAEAAPAQWVTAISLISCPVTNPSLRFVPPNGSRTSRLMRVPWHTSTYRRPCPTRRTWSRWPSSTPTPTSPATVSPPPATPPRTILDDQTLPQPECIGWQGDNPIENDDPDDAVPFDVEAVNKRLTALATAGY